MRKVIASVAVLMTTVFSSGQTRSPVRSGYLGFDRNLYPGDDSLPLLQKTFAFAGYWLNEPPGETINTWRGKREVLMKNDFGFLVLFNGRVEAQLRRSARDGESPNILGKHDASVAISNAQHEHFPAGTIIFLDQEEGGRLVDVQASYVLAWSEAIALSIYKPGIYLSGQPVNNGPGKTITTAQHVRDLVSIRHLHPITLFAYQDTCPPSNGCSTNPPSISSTRIPDLAIYQYAQSPRRPENTKACASTYATDGQCYALGVPKLYLDMDVSTQPDPSHGR